VGEAPPASGRFFYQADSGLYRAIREAFVEAFPALRGRHFLTSFRRMGCYLVDLCGGPVDHLNGGSRKKARREGETRLSVVLKQLCPEVVVTVVKSIAANVERSQARAGWSGLHMNLPYPGRWHHHRIAFIQALVLVLRKNFNRNLSRIAWTSAKIIRVAVPTAKPHSPPEKALLPSQRRRGLGAERV